ncbi:MAG: hypothetical protein DMF57_04335, partial [Acidobacteria bacterium]
MTPSETTPHRRRSDFEAGFPVLRALVVDDDAAFRASVSNLLQRLGFVVTNASEQRDVTAAIDSSAFDLLIVDSEMPRIDPYALIGTIRSSRRTADAYAMVITPKEGVDASIDALRAG